MKKNIKEVKELKIRLREVSKAQKVLIFNQMRNNNLEHDLQINQMFEELETIGFRLLEISFLRTKNPELLA